MAYTKTVWQDKVVQYPHRYKDQSNVQYTFTEDEGTVIVEGTKLNAGNMNKIENGIYDLDNGKASKSTVSTTTLVASNWGGSVAPYNYTISVSGVTSTNVVEILPSNTIGVDEAKAMSKAIISTGTQTTNSITLYSFGIKPTIDLPIEIIVRGDV